MATKKSSNSKAKTTTKKTTIKNDEIINVNIKEEETKQVLDANESKGSVDLEKLYSLMESLQAQVQDLKAENEALREEKATLEESMSEIEEGELIEIDVPVEVPTLNMDDPNRKITVYHTQEMSHNLSTYIKLSTTKRNFRKAGEAARFSINDFEELVGVYRRFFDKGILAVSVKDVDFAELYGLPIWDEKNKSVFTSKILREVSSYNSEQLREFYNNLSEDSKRSFLVFWLGKVYSKEQGFYNIEKIGWLKNIANTNIFDAILLEMNTNRARGTEDVVLNADKII